MAQSPPEPGRGTLASFMAPVAKDTHIGMGNGLVSAREGEKSVVTFQDAHLRELGLLLAP